MTSYKMEYFNRLGGGGGARWYLLTDSDVAYFPHDDRFANSSDK